MTKLDYSRRVSKFSMKQKLARLLWNICWIIFVRPFSLPQFRKWRLFVYRLFGAKIAPTAEIASSARVWAPWLLTLEDHTAIDFRVNVYNVDMVTLKRGAMVSQEAFICPGSHNIRTKNFPMESDPVVLGEDSWVAVRAFIGRGVHVGEGAVVGAMAVVYKDVEPWTVVGGNPAKIIGKREIKD